MSGTGKSSALVALGGLGYRVVDTDDPGWREYREYVEPPDPLHRGEWVWVEDRMTRLLDSDDGRSLFVAGCTRNQSKFYDRFDAVVLLSAPADVLLDRVARRTTNSYGQAGLERAMILDDLANIEPVLRESATHELDAGRTLDEVVADLIAIASGPITPPVTDPPVALPVLTDGHVLLRAAEPRDLPAIDAGMQDPDVIRWIGPPEGSAHDVLVQNEERWARGSPTMAICELDGTCVGKVWMEIRDTDRSTGFVGYWLLPAGRGRGLATSAVRLVSSWAVRELGVTRVRLTTAPDNERSQRVADRSGFRRLGPAAGDALEGPRRGQVVYALDGPGLRDV